MLLPTGLRPVDNNTAPLPHRGSRFHIFLALEILACDKGFTSLADKEAEHSGKG